MGCVRVALISILVTNLPVDVRCDPGDTGSADGDDDPRPARPQVNSKGMDPESMNLISHARSLRSLGARTSSVEERTMRLEEFCRGRGLDDRAIIACIASTTREQGGHIVAEVERRRAVSEQRLQMVAAILDAQCRAMQQCKDAMQQCKERCDRLESIARRTATHLLATHFTDVNESGDKSSKSPKQMGNQVHSALSDAHAQTRRAATSRFLVGAATPCASSSMRARAAWPDPWLW